MAGAATPEVLRASAYAPSPGRISVPGDKSIAQRALILAALAEGSSSIRGLPASGDVASTRGALEALGVEVSEREGALWVQGVGGAASLEEPGGPLDLGNSGTGMRLLMGALAGAGLRCTLMGDASLNRRPMERVAEPLRALGADVRTQGGCPPVEIHPVRSPLIGASFELEVASAQVQGALMMAALGAEGRVTVRTPGVCRDHTARMLRAFGAPVEVDGLQIKLQGPVTLAGTEIRVPGDLSAAAFPMVAHLIAGEGELVLTSIGVNPTRDGILDVLARMGADIEVDHHAVDEGEEPIADIRVRPSALQAVELDAADVARAIDEIPVLSVAAAYADGRTVIRGAAELRVKESDRIEAMTTGLAALGAQVEALPDGLAIQGGPLGPGRVGSLGDHRIAMSFLVAATGARGTVEVTGCGSIDTSFPGFIELIRARGARLEAA